jgi:hypothetical protein
MFVPRKLVIRFGGLRVMEGEEFTKWLGEVIRLANADEVVTHNRQVLRVIE